MKKKSNSGSRGAVSFANRFPRITPQPHGCFPVGSHAPTYTFCIFALGQLQIPASVRRQAPRISSCEITAPALDLPEHILTYSRPQSRCFSPRISPSLPDGRRRGMAAGAGGPWRWEPCCSSPRWVLQEALWESEQRWPRLWLRTFKNPGHSRVDKSLSLKAEGA